MQNINEIDDLIRLISKLPGLGPKSAKRIVLKLINNRDELIKPPIKSAIKHLKRNPGETPEKIKLINLSSID